MARREAFDPLRSYVANRDFSWGGKQITAGMEFSDRRDMRRLRQLYDGRYVRMDDTDSGAPDFKKMKEEELRQWLIDNGRVNLAHPMSAHHRLVDRCRRTWLELKQLAAGGVVAAKQRDAADGVDVGIVHPQGSSEGVQESVASRSAVASGGRVRERIG
jgi:hypothetical protein